MSPAWTDSNGKFILIGNENGKLGEPLLSIPADPESVVEWIRALTSLLDEGDLIDLPGEFTKFTEE